MEDSMKKLYDEIILLYEMVTPLIRIHNKSQEIQKLLKVENKYFNLIKEWGSKYTDVP